MAEADLRGKALYFDCFAGVAGDMFLGAALHLGVPEAYLRQHLARLPLSGHRLQIARTRRSGIEGVDLKVLPPEGTAPEASPEPGGHGHHHHHHGGGEAGHQHHGPADQHAHPPGGDEAEHHHGGHTAWRTIRRAIEAAELPGGTTARALDIFGRIARAEASLHGMDPEGVTFHEVGAVDSIVDIVGAALVLDYLRPTRVTARPVPLGHGTTRCAHGLLPVPAPATLAIAAEAGVEVEDGGVAMELCTPTGAAIVAHCAEGYGPLPAGRVAAVGYGAGDRTMADRPNLLRLVLLEPAAGQRAPGEDEADHRAVVLEANIDNMAPELCGHLLERLFEEGARDVWYTPITMKKGRPALTISVLCAESRQQALAELLLRESTTIGLRHHPVGRLTLERRIEPVQTPYGPIPIKVAGQGGETYNAAPEYEACRQAARRHGVPLKEIYAAAAAAHRAKNPAR